jgi:hypothetical protein
MKRILLVLALALLLTGCPPGQQPTLKTLTLYPSRTDGLGWYEQYSNSQNWECSTPLPGQGFFLQGTGPEPVPSGEIAVGYEDMFLSGSGPFPCQQEQQMLYRGHVMFHFSQFNWIAGATLQFYVIQSESQTAGTPEQPPNSYANVLGMSTGLINGSNGPYYWPYDNDVTLACPSPSLIMPYCQIDVSTQARQWASGAHPNYGFMLAGPLLSLANSLPQDNNAQLTWYGGFVVQVLYNPAQNPNAPQ